MDDREREQSNLIKLQRSKEVRRKLDDGIRALFADHSAKGLLYSGATIKKAVRLMEQTTDSFLTLAIIQFLQISPDSDGFSAMSESVQDCLTACADHMPAVIRIGSGRQASVPNNNIERAANDLFSEMRSTIEAKLAISAFNFRHDVPKKTEQSHPITMPIIPLKKGGRQPADYWDAMWVEIAVLLFTGDLVPKSQADVERAMSSWIEGNGYSAAVSTVRARARKLWDRLSVTD